MRVAWMMTGCLMAASLAACQRPATHPTPQAAVASPAAADASTAALGAARAPGLWEQRVSDGVGVQVTRICLDAATDRQMALAGRQLNESQCRSHSVSQGPGGWRIATVCDMGAAGQVSTTGIATGDFARRYEIRLDQTTTGAPTSGLNGHRRLVVTAALQGPCPAGMAPGQMVDAGGQTVSLASQLPAGPPPILR